MLEYFDPVALKLVGKSDFQWYDNFQYFFIHQGGLYTYSNKLLYPNLKWLALGWRLGSRIRGLSTNGHQYQRLGEEKPKLLPVEEYWSLTEFLTVVEREL